MGRKRNYIKLDTGDISKYSLCKYCKIVPTAAMNIVWPDENDRKNKIIRLKGKEHQEESSSPRITTSNDSLLGNELKNLLNSERNNNLKEGIEIGTKKGIEKTLDKMLGHISGSELVEERYRFDNSKSVSQKSISAFNIYIKCIENGCYPPEEILSFIANKFNDFMGSDNKLDTVFGVNKSSKKAYFKRIKNMNFVLEIDLIKHNLGISINDAIDSVLQLYKDKGIHFSLETLEDIYYRDGKKEIDNSSMEQHRRICAINIFDDDEITKHLEEILMKYPERVINKLKAKYAHIKPLLSSLIEK
ncbi:hypothetical protein [Trichlorobacter lovleyi]|uniref:hypothetical protein n=1 Tax=Trichlorobacter lovleyi TaxID=313985 RepID=UPI0023F3FC65|nr:hypothetical protein [Trichlorobacter lovleyi]